MCSTEGLIGKESMTVQKNKKNIMRNTILKRLRKNFLTLNFIQENKDSQIKNFHFLKYGNLIF